MARPAGLGLREIKSGELAHDTRQTESEEMEQHEMEAKATIAAALIVRGAVEVPTIPTSGDWSKDTASLRLRDLTDYIYQMITSPRDR